MNYQEIQPPDYLRGYVRYVWTLENTGNDFLPTTLRPIADGCPGVMFHQSEQGALRQNGKQLPGLFLYGQTTQCLELATSGKFRTIGVVLNPDALLSVFGLNACVLTDSCVDLNSITQPSEPALFEQLSNPSTITTQISELANYLSAQIKRNHKDADSLAKYVLAQLIRSNGSISLKSLQEDIRLSERSLERRFKQSIGVSPKLFARICRFQASLKQLKQNNHSKLSDIAFEHEYADQSHFIRTFKEFAGCSPLQFQKQTDDTAESFSLLK